MLTITESADGPIFSVKARPKASKDRIIREHSGALKISVTAAPEKGKANAAVIALLSEKLGVPKSSIEIVRGETSRLKTVRIHGVTTESLLRILGPLTR